MAGNLHGHGRVYDAVYVDVNTILHNYARSTYELGYSVDRTLQHIRQFVMTRCQPVGTLFLSIDGAASIPKLHLQRARRLQPNRNGVDCRQFTPGCVSMLLLQGWLERFSIALQRQYKSMSVIVDPGTNAGEGEHKIIRDINLVKPRRVAIISSDSDLLVYPLVMDPRVSVDIHMPFSEEIFEIANLKSSLEQECGHGNFGDFLILALLSGNDYMPGIGWANIKSTFDAYVEWCRTSAYRPFLKSIVDLDSLHAFLVDYKENHLPATSFRFQQEVDEAQLQRACDYTAVLQWLVESLHGRPDASNTLCDMPSFTGGLTVSLDALIASIEKNSDSGTNCTNCTMELAPVKKLSYVPGAIGMCLLRPNDDARQYLPMALQKIKEEAEDPVAWWTSTPPSDLLIYYNKVIAEMVDTFTDQEKQVIMPGRQLRLLAC